MGKKGKQKILLPFKFDYPIIDNLKNQKIKEPEYVDVFNTSIPMNNNILDLLEDPKTSEKMKISILQNNFDYIIDEISNAKNKYIDLINIIFLNTQNVTLFINISRNRNITDTTRRCICKICQDYITMYNQDNNYMNLLQLADVVNSYILPGLLGVLNNNRDLASRIAIARYSDTSNLICIKNINRIIIQNNLDTQTIINVYSKLFDSVTDIFLSVIFDVDYTLYCNEIYGNISNATLYILDSLPSEDIKRVLYVYLQHIQLWKNMNVRFSLNSISAQEFPKIVQVVTYLRDVEKIYLP